EAVAHAGGEHPHERRGGPARAEPHDGVVLDEPEGPACESAERFRCVELHVPAPITRSPTCRQRLNAAASACRARSVSPTSRGDLPAPADHAPGFTRVREG